MLRNVREGIGATRHLDHGSAWDPAEVGPEPSSGKRPRPVKPRAEPQEQSEADVIAAEANARESVEAQAEPVGIDDCGSWGDQEVGKIIRLYRSGAFAEDIAAAIGESVQTVTYELAAIRSDLNARYEGRPLGEGRSAPRKRLSRDRLDQIVALHREKQKVRYIAATVGVSESTVRYVIEREGGD